MKHLLAICWEMPPVYGPRATQVSRTLSELASRGWQPKVVCLDPRRGGPNWRDGKPARLPEGLCDEANLLRVRSPEEWWPLRAAWRIAPVLRDVPDSKWVWIGRAARAATRAARTADFAGLITFGPPWSDHLVGLRVARATGLPWVVHFSDPWVDRPFWGSPAWQQPMWRRVEAAVIRQAKAVVFVTSQTAELVMKKYPQDWRQKVSVVPHGFDSRAMRPPGARPRRMGPMRIVHTGRFYRGARTPVPLFKALATMNAQERLAGAVEVVLVGPHSEEFRKDAEALGVGSLVRFTGLMSPADAFAIAGEADLLLVIDAPSSGPSVFLPSKLVDYLPLRTPILGITPEEGASADLLRRLGCPVAQVTDIDAIASSLRDLVRRWKAGTLAVARTFDEVAAEYDIRRTSGCLDDLLNRVIAERSRN